MLFENTPVLTFVKTFFFCEPIPAKNESRQMKYDL